MAISLTHTTVAVGTDAGNGEIAKAQWNENHTLTMATARLLGRTTAGAGAVEEISVGTGLSLSGGSLTNTVTATSPGGSNTQLQFNNSGSFGGASGLTTNGTELTIASGTKTTSSPVIDAAQTWNAGGVTFTAIKLNVTDTASQNTSRLLDIQVGGSSRYYFDKVGAANIVGPSSNNYAGIYVSQSGQSFASIGFAYQNTSTAALYFGPGTSGFDLIVTRRAAANLRLGAVDAAAPVAQTLSVQSVVAGTSNTAGANLTITGSQGTGTGAGGSIIFQVAPAGSSGTAQNALSTALTISSAGNVFIGNAAIATNATDGFLYVPSCAGAPSGTPTTVTGRIPIVVDSTNNKLYFYSGGAWRDAGP